MPNRAETDFARFVTTAIAVTLGFVVLETRQARADTEPFADLAPSLDSIGQEQILTVEVLPRDYGEGGWLVTRFSCDAISADGNVETPALFDEAAEGHFALPAIAINQAAGDGYYVLPFRISSGASPGNVRENHVYLQIQDGTASLITEDAYTTASIPSDGRFIGGSFIPSAVTPNEARLMGDPIPEHGHYGENEGSLTLASPTAHPSAAGCETGRSARSQYWSIALILAGVLIASRMRRRRGLAMFALLSVSPSLAKAVTHKAYGYVTFWDTRTNRSDATGSRFPTCDTGITSCDWWTAGCCFTPIPRIKVNLWRFKTGLSPVLADSDHTSGTGYFQLDDTGWTSGSTYSLTVTFEASIAPHHFEILDDTGTGGYSYTASIGSLPSSYNYFSNLNITPAGDTGLTVGNLASIWTTLQDTADIFEAEGETRHRKEFGSANAFDKTEVRYPATSSTLPAWQDCNDNIIWVKPAASRTSSVAHEFGHELHAHLVGCSGINRAFPKLWSGMGKRQHGAEGGSITEAYANMVQILAFRDPDTLGSITVAANWGYACNNGSIAGACTGGTCPLTARAEDHLRAPPLT